MAERLRRGTVEKIVDFGHLAGRRDTGKIWELALSHTLATWYCLQKVGSASTPSRIPSVSCARSSASGVEKHSTPGVRQQVLAYIDSEDLEEIALLSTDAHEKYLLSATDFEIMARGIFEDTEGFRTARMMLQVLYALLLQSLSERPGAIIESSSHSGTNEALMWRDHEFHVLPNPDDPHSPVILIRIKSTFSRDNARITLATRSSFSCQRHTLAPFAPFPSSPPWPSRTTSFLTSRQPTTSSIPEIPQLRHTPALRSDIFDSCAWITSPTRALTYAALSSHLRRVGINKGFIRHVTCYCCRRGAPNRISREMTKQDRNTLMGHTEGSAKFDTSYTSCFIGTDLGAILQDRDENVEDVKAGKALMDMSARRDENVPIGLTPEGKAALLAELELVEMDNERKELANQIASLSKQLTCPDITNET
ncbi:hypothetical protein EV421DRAFT_2036345 [Armillaria borealis]|uniref:Uncharacterized protein n=1 Tax=Armillaria borealis TaxID=47425 RepID=A0AA39JEJ0_9AGAR|nr:hypothetical protein EV421DRAFT_2036345 [Armillaria borealis]